MGISLFLKDNDIDNDMNLSLIFQIISLRAMTNREGKEGEGVAILVRNDIIFDIIDMCS